MDVEPILNVAEELAKAREEEALRLLVRQASLPLLAEAMLGWASQRKVEVLLDRVIPSRVYKALAEDLGGQPVSFGGKVSADLARDTVISSPWSQERMKKVLSWVGPKTWKYDPTNHYAYRYSPLGVVIFYNGLHSGAVGILKRQGVLQVEEVDLGPMYQAGLQIRWLPSPGKKEKIPHAVFRNLAEPIPEENHALLLALGEILHRHGVRL